MFFWLSLLKLCERSKGNADSDEPSDLPNANDQQLGGIQQHDKDFHTRVPTRRTERVPSARLFADSEL